MAISAAIHFVHGHDCSHVTESSMFLALKNHTYYYNLIFLIQVKKETANGQDYFTFFGQNFQRFSIIHFEFLKIYCNNLKNLPGNVKMQ